MQAKGLTISKPKQVPDRDRLFLSQSPLTFDTPDFECASSWRSPSIPSKAAKKGRLAGRHSTVGSLSKMAKAQGSEHRTMSISSDESSDSSVGESVGLVDLRSTKRELHDVSLSYCRLQVCEEQLEKQLASYILSSYV